MLTKRLGWLLAQQGIRSFVTELLPRLNERVGTAWLQGDISVPDEHIYSEQVAGLMHGIVAGIPHDPIGPRVLLTTLPGEQHRLGLLMVEATLRLELAECIPLGTQTPMSDIVDKSVVMGVDVVALSFSGASRAQPALKSLLELRAALPDHIAIWAGGDGISRVRRAPDGIIMPMTLESIPSEVSRLRPRVAPPMERAYGQPRKN
jgi:methanogenic corrinoid protein MtbC1